MGAKEQSSIRTGAEEKSAGRLLALDLGTKRVGVAVCDELRLAVRPLDAINRRSWKDLLHRVIEEIEKLGAVGLVIGLPLNIDGSEGDAARTAREAADKFRLSINLPVYLQDERLTTEEARSQLRASGKAVGIDQRVDSEAAAIILSDFISRERREYE